MAFAASDASSTSSEPRKMSLGPVNAQLLTWTCVSGDTSGTVTADKLSSVSHIIIDGGLVMNAAPTFANNVVTLSFNDPVATVFGDIIVLGK